MIADPTAASLKDRCEATIIGELIASPKLKALFPKKQNTDSRPKLPYIAVVATPGSEISPGAGIYNISVSIEVYFMANREGQDSDKLDVVCRCVDDQLTIAQARGVYGLIKQGEQPVQFVNETIRKRVVLIRLIAG